MKRIVSLLLSIALLLGITAGIDLSAYAVGAINRFLDPSSNEYVMPETANQFDFFEKYHNVEHIKKIAGNEKDSNGNYYAFNPDREGIDICDIYAKKIGIVDAKGNPVGTEYERIAKIYQYMYFTHTYTVTGGSTDAESFIARTGYCETFSWAVNALCKEAGIESWTVSAGTDYDTVPIPHAWNIVKIEGKYYDVDVAGKKFLSEPKSHMDSYGTQWSRLIRAADDKIFEGTGNNTGFKQWIAYVGSNNLATSSYPKSTIDAFGNVTNPTLGLATPSVVSTVATNEGVIVKFNGVANADWYEVYTAPFDGITNDAYSTVWDSATRTNVKKEYKGDHLYYKGVNYDSPFNFTKVATVHSIDKNESGQYQCFLENTNKYGVIVYIVAKNVKGECNLIVDPTLSTANTDKLMEEISAEYERGVQSGTDKNTGRAIEDFAIAKVNSTNYTIYNANAKHKTPSVDNHSYTKIATIRKAENYAQGADLYECKDCLLRKVKYTPSLTGSTTQMLATPKISTLENTSTGVKITWGKVSGAEKYRVYYKVSGGSWTKIADTTSTSYTWTGAKSGTKYTFTVRCLNSAATAFTSSFDSTGKSLTYVAAPKLSSVENTASGVKITWAKSTGAEKYRVYYKVSGGSWTKIADTTSTSYTWTGAKSGTKYTFTVRCLNSAATAFTSSYDSTGKSLTYVAAPKLSSVENTASGVKITWAKSTGAEKYRVYYKVSGGSWTKIADTTSTSYTWTGAKSGTKYTFTVRCLNSAATAFTSSFDSTGKSLTYVAAPKLSSVENTASGVKITWAKSTGAAKYRVYYKVSGGSWTKIADTTSTSYTWTGAKSGTKYTFTVRCLNSAATAFTSSFDSTGKSITYIAAPKLSSVSKSSSGITINWAKSTGAVKYRVYYKTAGGSWTKIADTTSTSYTWTGGKAGTKYTFTVRCINSAGNAFTSSYDATGKSITK